MGVNGSHVVISHGNGLSASSGSVHASGDPTWQGVIDYNDGQRIDYFNKISDDTISGTHGTLPISFTATLRAQVCTSDGDDMFATGRRLDCCDGLVEVIEDCRG